MQNLVILILVILSLINQSPKMPNEVSAHVESYNEETKCAVLVDTYGESWFYEGEIEEGKNVIIVFDDMGTADPYDDEIISIRNSQEKNYPSPN